MIEPSGMCRTPGFVHVQIDLRQGCNMRKSTQSLTGLFQVPNGLHFFLAHTIILDKTSILSDILTLDLQSCLWRLCFENKVVVAVRTVLVALLELLNILAESLFALFAGEYHFEGGLEVVCFGLSVAFCAVEPFAACGCAVLVMGLRQGGGGAEGLAAG